MPAKPLSDLLSFDKGFFSRYLLTLDIEQALIERSSLGVCHTLNHRHQHQHQCHQQKPARPPSFLPAQAAKKSANDPTWPLQSTLADGDPEMIPKC